MPKPRSRKERSTPPVYLTLWWSISLVSMVGLVAWSEYSHVSQLADLQTVSARLAAERSAGELRDRLGRVVEFNAAMLAEASAQSRRLGGDEADTATLLARRLKQFYPHWQGLVLSDANGGQARILTARSMRWSWWQRLRHFASGDVDQEQTLAPDDGRIYLDILQRVTLTDGGTRLLLTRFDPAPIAKALAGDESTGITLLLAIGGREKPAVFAAPGPDHGTIQARPPLSDSEQRLVAQRGSDYGIRDSAWRIIALPDNERLSQARLTSLQRGTAFSFLIVALGLVVMTRLRGAAVGQDISGQRVPLQERSRLASKLRRRTKALADANAALAGQIERRRKAERRMIMLTRAVEHTGDSIIVTDRQGVIAYANPAFVRLTGRAAGEVVGTSLADLQTAHQPSEFMRRLWSHLEREEAFREIFCIRNADGQPCYTEQTISPLRNSKGEITRLIATGKDITERMDSEKRLSYLAHHDTLTGLPNRALMFDRLEHALARANRRSTLVALLFMDIDRFKTINDSLGHQAGDELLKAVAERLGRSVRRSDSIARLGGDEFVAILEDIHHTDEPVHVANAILAAIAEPLVLTGHEVSVTSSMGIALFPEDGGDPNMLLQCADAAMYKAKAQGGNTYNFYTADMTADAQRRLHLESRLRNALEKGEFRLLYQPRLALHEDRITAVEALLRWQPEDGTLQSPADFMEILEETGLIRPVGEWILQQVCADFVRLQQAGHRVRIACNLSAKQFRDTELVEIIDRTVLDQAMRPQDLELELTESLLAEDADHAADMLAALRDRGVRISVDDFGTGYSSLGYLKRFPIDNLKIDQSFVRQLNADKDDAAIVSAVISLAHSLGLGAVAEGVETQAQLQTLGLLGCDEVQGMLLSEPLAMDDLLIWLDAR